MEWAKERRICTRLNDFLEKKCWEGGGLFSVTEAERCLDLETFIRQSHNDLTGDSLAADRICIPIYLCIYCIRQSRYPWMMQKMSTFLQYTDYCRSLKKYSMESSCLVHWMNVYAHISRFDLDKCICKKTEENCASNEFLLFCLDLNENCRLLKREEILACQRDIFYFSDVKGMCL